MSSTTSTAAVAETLELPLKSNPQLAVELVGPSSQGWVYREPGGSTYYRLLPIHAHIRDRRRSDDAPIERRAAIQAWVEAAAGSPEWLPKAAQWQIVLPARAEMVSRSGDQFLVVHYACPTGCSLADVLTQADPLARLQAVAHVLRGVPRWWQCLEPGRLPMPADILLLGDSHAMLLALPRWRLPDAEAVVAVPERAVFLPPEYIRGTEARAIGYNADRYAVGALLMQCFFRCPRGEATALLRGAASGRIWEEQTSLLPYWQQQLDGTRAAVAAARKLIDRRGDVRSTVDPGALAVQVDQWRHEMEPRTALNKLVAAGRWDDADRLLQDILLFDDSAGLLSLAAEIAVHCRRPLEAVQYCEKAIEQDPDRLQAYLQQFHILTAAETRSELDGLIHKRDDAGGRLDSQVARDFKALRPEWRTDDRFAALAEHALWRGQEDQAANLLYNALRSPAINAGDEKIPGLRLRLRQLYIRVLARIEARRSPPRFCAAARAELRTIRALARNAYDQGRIGPDDLAALGRICDRDEHDIDSLETTGLQHDGGRL